MRTDFRGASYITKNEYIRYRKNWKKEYKRLAVQIKLIKIGYKERLSYGTFYNDASTFDDGRHLQSLASSLVKAANAMMLDLEYVKLCAKFSVHFDRFVNGTNS